MVFVSESVSESFLFKFCGLRVTVAVDELATRLSFKLPLTEPEDTTHIYSAFHSLKPGLYHIVVFRIVVRFLNMIMSVFQFS